VATIDMGRKEGGAGLLCPFPGELGPRLTQCGLSRDLLPYQVASSSIQPFGHNRHGPKTGGYAPFRGASTPSNTTSLGPRFTSVPSGILIHPAVWLQLTWAENWVGAVLFFWQEAGSPSNTMSPRLRPTSVPSGILISVFLVRCFILVLVFV